MIKWQWWAWLHMGVTGDHANHFAQVWSYSLKARNWLWPMEKDCDTFPQHIHQGHHHGNEYQWEAITVVNTMKHGHHKVGPQRITNHANMMFRGNLVSSIFILQWKHHRLFQSALYNPFSILCYRAITYHFPHFITQHCTCKRFINYITKLCYAPEY